MTTEWMIRGPEFGNCNCESNCPCQFGMPKPSHGFCDAVMGGTIEEGFFGETRLDGLNWALSLHFPGAVHEGNGQHQIFIDERADDQQRDAIRKILYGEETDEFATHFFVYHAMSSQVYDPIYAPIEVDIDVDARSGHISVPGLVEINGGPLLDAVEGKPHRIRLDLPNGFEYRIAEVGQASCTISGTIPIQLENTFGLWCNLHMTGRGVVD